ncbi:MAG: arylsulfatase [Roseibacillus sp.]
MRQTLGIFLCAVLQAVGPMGAAPNIIFILCDDLGYGDLGVTWQKERDGEKKHHTPHLDQMAAEGVLMTRHYCPAPVCAPSRASFLTGFHQGHCGIRNNQFDKALPDDHTIASTLKAGGYRTALVGKYGLQGKGKSPREWPAYPTKRGFDDFLGYVRHADGHLHYPAHKWPLGNSEGHRSKKELWHNEEEISGSLAKCFTSDLFTAYAKKWIVDGLRENPEQPFFLYLAYDTPHAALQYPTSAYPEGGGLEGGLQWLGEPGKMINTAVGKVDSWMHPEHDNADWNESEKRQAGMIRRIDDHVGDLIQLLKDLEVDEETLVVFTSDNGPHDVHYLAEGDYDASRFQAYGPLNGIKRDVLEGGIRMPALARWPKSIPAGQVDRSPSQFHDWMTTFLAAAGMPLPAQADGVSLLPALTGQGKRAESTVYVEYSNGSRTPSYEDFLPKYQGQKRGEQQVIFLDGYKGIRRNLKKADEYFQIFDIEEDEREKVDLADSSPQFKALQRKMQERVLRLRRPSKNAKRPYDTLPIPAMAPCETKKGLNRQFMAGEFPWVPRLKEGEGEVVSNLQFVTEEAGAVWFSGLIEVAVEGDFVFRLGEQGEAVFHLHDCLVLDSDIPKQIGGSREATVKLAKGLHPFRLGAVISKRAPDFEVTGPVGSDISFRLLGKSEQSAVNKDAQ